MTQKKYDDPALFSDEIQIFTVISCMHIHVALFHILLLSAHILESKMTIPELYILILLLHHKIPNKNKQLSELFFENLSPCLPIAPGLFSIQRQLRHSQI